MDRANSSRPLRRRLGHALGHLIPGVRWLPRYDVKANLAADLIASATISTIIIPQSMAYAMLANLPPVYGLYTSMVPIVIYGVFTTCHQLTTGMFALVALLLGHAASQIMEQQASSASAPIDQTQYISICLILSFCTGLIQVTCSFLGLGKLVANHLLPDSLITGLTTAAGFHIATSQIRNFFGVTELSSLVAAPAVLLTQHRTAPFSILASADDSGFFTLFRSWVYLATHLTAVHWPTLLMASTSVGLTLCLRWVERWRLARHQASMALRQAGLVDEAWESRSAVSSQIAPRHCSSEAQDRTSMVSVSSGFLSSAIDSDHEHCIDPSEPSGGREAMPGGKCDPRAFDTLSTSSSTIDADDSRSHLVIHIAQAIEPRISERTTLLPPSWGTQTKYGATLGSDADDESVESPTLTVVTGTEPSGIYIPIPDILVVIVVYTVATYMCRWDLSYSIATVGAIPSGLPSVHFPLTMVKISFSELWELYLPWALQLSAIAYLMTISIAKTFSKRHGGGAHVHEDQEMFALGLSTMIGSCFAGIVNCGSLTRSAVLCNAGAKTQVASLVSVVVVAATVLWLTPLFYYLPFPVLAGVVMLSCQGLVQDIVQLGQYWQQRRFQDVFLFGTIFTAVIALNIKLGIAVGICCAMLVALGQAIGWLAVPQPCSCDDASECTCH
ncbi:hypothetical protein H4R34_003199 [Dimargaris verticillata]|uniref:SLC26A/SulP transporter domain-containing protein n=1 Tax=Dimargaris verticillata TaxID=2761393 RepID=A0A9W8B6P0_9FUNG|nr:hypothetical protein H4R34_003199 [Dimargaris verticillata]